VGLVAFNEVGEEATQDLGADVLTREVDEADAGSSHRSGKGVCVRVDVGIERKLHDEDSDREAGIAVNEELGHLDHRYEMAHGRDWDEHELGMGHLDVADPFPASSFGVGKDGDEFRGFVC